MALTFAGGTFAQLRWATTQAAHHRVGATFVDLKQESLSLLACARSPERNPARREPGQVVWEEWLQTAITPRESQRSALCSSTDFTVCFSRWNFVPSWQAVK